MNREDIIRMAREAGIRFRRDVFHSGYCDGVHGDELEAFAALVASAERERIAKKIEQLPFGDTSASFAIFVREA